VEEEGEEVWARKAEKRKPPAQRRDW